MALRLDSIRSIPSCLGLLLAEEIWSQLRNWGAGRDRIRCNSSDWGSCTTHISTDGWTWAERLRTSLDSHPELGIVVGWAVVALALVSICCNCESRGRLLGRGKGLALLALAVLCIVLGLNLLTAWRCGGRVA